MKAERIADKMVTEFQNRERLVQILMAHGDGSIKRRLGLYGDYKKHRQAAITAIYDDAFYLTIAVSLIDASPILRWKYRRLVAKVDKLTKNRLEKLGEPETSETGKTAG